MEHAQVYTISEEQSQDLIPSRIYSETDLEVLVKGTEERYNRKVRSGQKGMGTGGRKKLLSSGPGVGQLVL